MYYCGARLPGDAVPHDAQSGSPGPVRVGGRRRVIVFASLRNIEMNRQSVARGRRAPSVFVLDVFDDEAAMYVEYLHAMGFDVQSCRDAAEALVAIERRPPDVVVTRLRQTTSALTGIDVVRRVKQNPRTSAVPVLMITSSMLATDRRAAEEVRCDAYMVLPVLPDELVAQIRQLLTARVRKLHS
jgi:CheY-like chemotaxis protein